MPDRIVRVGILTSDAISKLSFSAEVFLRRLMSVVDDYGRYDGRTVILRATLYPLVLDRVCEADLQAWMDECLKAGLVRLYQNDEGKPFIEIQKFNQRIQSKSKWPAPPGTVDSPKFTVKHGRSQKSTAYSDSDSYTETKSLTDAESMSEFDSLSRPKTLSPQAMETISENSSSSMHSKRSLRSQTDSNLGDEEFVVQLQKDPAYAELNVRQEFARMHAWCKTNNKTPSRKLLLNWLDRAEKPMDAQVAFRPLELAPPVDMPSPELRALYMANTDRS